MEMKNKMNTVRIMDIKRFAVHDGDGIRTTVFVKGCSLKCVWCHNPEGIGYFPQLAYYAHKCIQCGECVKVCPKYAHTITREGHIFDRTVCEGCGKCEEICLGNALKLYGKKMSVDELLPILLKDKDFYKNSGGGVTISGGECLTQPEFCSELLKRLKKEGIHTAIDTCGNVNRDAIDMVMDYTDVFLYDIKAIDEKVHIRCTGHSNKKILDNLKYITSCGKEVEIRIPYVPGYNTDEISRIEEYLSTLTHITNVKVLPYHNLASTKYDALGMENTLPLVIPSKEEVNLAEKKIRENLKLFKKARNLI